MFIVRKGEFELTKKLPRGEASFDGAVHMIDMLGQRVEIRNVLAKRLPEIKDLPYNLKLTIFGSGSLLGEEDIFSRDKYSCTAKCYSQKGSLYELKKEHFQMLKASE